MATGLACSLEPLKIDPCQIWPDDLSMCHAVPINQIGKAPYDRKLNPGDVCIDMDGYASAQKFSREVLRRCKALKEACGDRCLNVEGCD